MASAVATPSTPITSSRVCRLARSQAAHGVQAVADAAHRLHEAAAQLAAQVADVHLDRVRVDVGGRVPDVVEDLDLGDHPAGDVRLDPATRQVTVAGDPVALTPREFGLLEYLLRRPGRVVTKIEVLDHVWDAAADVNPNAVEVYVGYLRRKLGRRLVETVRGVGYRLDP